jgi:hypothetical protein
MQMNLRIDVQTFLRQQHTRKTKTVSAQRTVGVQEEQAEGSHEQLLERKQLLEDLANGLQQAHTTSPIETS